MSTDLQTILADGEVLIRSGANPDGITPAALVAAGGALLSGDAGLLATQNTVAQYMSEVVTFPSTVAQSDVAGSIRFDRSGTILYVSAWCDVAPTVASVIVDAHKNGTTIYTTQGNRPAIATSQVYNRSVAPNVTSIAQGDAIQFQVDQLNAGDQGDIGQMYVRITWTESIA